MGQKPAVSLAAMPGRRQATIALAQEIERRGFAGIYCPSFNDGVGLCEALALTTKTIRIGTGIANIYTRHPVDYAQTASLIHELSGGRFLFGIGVSHAAVNKRLGIHTGKPLADTRRFVEQFRDGGGRHGELPPIVLATLRKPMVRLAAEIGAGAMWANAARSHMGTSLSYVPADKRHRADFFIGNMIPTCISDDRQAAAAVNRKTLAGYVTLPNYQNYWIEAGYEEEMRAIQRVIAEKRFDEIPSLMSDRWLSDTTLFGSVAEVREGLEAWYAAGVSTPILVPSSTVGGQMQAFKEFLAAFE